MLYFKIYSFIPIYMLKVFNRGVCSFSICLVLYMMDETQMLYTVKKNYNLHFV